MENVVISKHIKKMILISFSLTIFLVLILGIFSIVRMISLADQTQKLYKHPFTVTNSVKNIQLNFISMHESLHDISQLKDKERIKSALDDIHTSQINVDKEFVYIYSRYLGDKKDIQKVQDAFTQWELILQECLALIKQGKTKEARCLMEKEGEEQMEKLDFLTTYLMNFAQEKADYFVKSSQETMYTSVYVIALLLPLIIIIILGIMFFLIKGMLRVHTHLQKQQEIFLMQSRMAQMGEMISMIAHQWRQPLAAISAITINFKLKLSLDKYDLSKEEEREKCVDYITKGTNDIDTYIKNLTTTLSDFRNFYKPNKKSVIIPIQQPVRKALHIVDSSLASDGIELLSSYDCKEEVRLYENEFVQVILNIINNAQDNLKEKEVIRPQISISCRTLEDELALEICDNGGGIPEEIMDKIFDPYFSTKEEKNGTGLGLHMSKVIIEDHHEGKLEVQNRNGGACFTIKIKYR